MASSSSEVSFIPTNLGSFPHRLSFYEKPPTDEITLEEFEEWAICRLRLLADIEAGYARNKSHDEIKKTVENRAKEHLPLGSNTSRDAVKERKKDLYSHFILRLAFCRSYGSVSHSRAWILLTLLQRGTQAALPQGRDDSFPHSLRD